MAILIINIDDQSTLALNEFFDYQGYCYGLSKRRDNNTSICIDLEDFYEGSVAHKSLNDVGVVFIHQGADGYEIIGWYKKAKIYRELQLLSWFLEGNIKAHITDVVWLETPIALSDTLFNLAIEGYEVIESDDERYHLFNDYMMNESVSNQLLKFHELGTLVSKKYVKQFNAKRNIDFEATGQFCLEQCMVYASKIMNDHCDNIKDIKYLLEFSELSLLYLKEKADAYYYQAMAYYQLGDIRKGLKAINKALAEDINDDFLALKANLKVSQKDLDEASVFYQKAYDISNDDIYLMMLGKVYLLKGLAKEAYDLFKVLDQELLSEAGISLKELEKQWPSFNIKEFKIKNIFRRRSKND